MSPIPVLELTKYESDSAEDRSAFCAQLYAALSEYGFVKIDRHGISDAVLENVFSWSKRSFHMPVEHKAKAAHPSHPNPHRGWSSVGQEKLSVIRLGRSVLDLKESFDQGPCNDSLYPNIWNDEDDLPGFRSFMEQFYEQCHDLHLRLLSAIAESMHLSPSFFSSQCGQNSSELRLNFYPSANHCDLSEGNMRISSHSDFGTITLLFQDDVGGLEIESQTETGNYIPIASGGKTELLLNVGDCLQRWTNGEILHPYVGRVHLESISKHALTDMPALDRLRSANHRVTLPVDLKASAESIVDERYSVAYFGKPDRHALVRSLPEVAQGQPLRYTETMTAWEFNQARLLQTY